MTYFKWINSPNPSWTGIYEGSFWIADKKIAELEVFGISVRHQLVYTVTLSSIFRDRYSLYLDEGNFDTEVGRTHYLMNHIYDYSKDVSTLSAFEYHCIALDWLRKNTGLKEDFDAKQRCKYLFPLLSKEDVPDLIVLLDQFLQKGELSHES